MKWWLSKAFRSRWASFAKELIATCAPVRSIPCSLTTDKWHIWMDKRLLEWCATTVRRESVRLLWERQSAVSKVATITAIFGCNFRRLTSNAAARLPSPRAMGCATKVSSPRERLCNKQTTESGHFCALGEPRERHTIRNGRRVAAPDGTRPSRHSSNVVISSEDCDRLSAHARAQAGSWAWRDRATVRRCRYWRHWVGRRHPHRHQSMGFSE